MSNEHKSLNSIFEKISQLTGIEGLEKKYESARDRNLIVTDLEENEHRKALPNRTSKRRFDKELKRQKTKQKAQNKAKKANIRLLAKLKKRVMETIGYEKYKPKLIPADIWYDCQTIVWDRDGKAIPEFSRQCPNKIAISRIHRSALGIDETGERQYNYFGDSRGSLRARRIFALGWAKLRLAVGTRRKGPYNRLVAGLPQAAFRALLRDPKTGEQVYRTTLSGEHRPSHKPSEIGYLDALKDSGFCYTRQAKWQGKDPNIKGWEDIRSEERAGSNNDWNFSTARYWIITSQYTDSKDAEVRARLWIDYIAGCQPFDRWFDEDEKLSVPILADVHGENSDLRGVGPPE